MTIGFKRCNEDMLQFITQVLSLGSGTVKIGQDVHKLGSLAQPNLITIVRVGFVPVCVV